MKTPERAAATSPFLFIAGMLLESASQPISAQGVTKFDTGGTTSSGIACAPSNNGTGHLVCVQYIGSDIGGVSWEAPPAPGGSQAAGTIDHITPVAFASGQSAAFSPSCGSANDGTGTVNCVVYSRLPQVGVQAQPINAAGVGFYPPGSAAASPLLPLFSEPASALVSLPTCTSADTNAPGSAHGVVLCAVAVNNQIYGVAFEPYTGTKTALTLLSPATGFSGNPSCASAPPSAVAMCAMEQGGGLTGFAFEYNAAGNKVSLVGSLQSLGANTFGSDPSCAVPRNVTPPSGDGGAYAVTCAIVGSATTPNALLGVTFDLQKAPTRYQTIATAPVGSSSSGFSGTWADRALSCASPNAGNPNNTIACVAQAGLNFDLYAVNFDPRTAQTSGLAGPFAIDATGFNLSCISLNIDANQITCGATWRDGQLNGTGGFNIANP
jgi:hypothetical protein